MQLTSQVEAFGLRVLSTRRNKHHVIRQVQPAGEANWVLSASASDRKTETINLATLKRIAKRLGAPI